MLPPVLDLAGQTEPAVFDFLYPYFRRDFVDRDTYIANRIYVDPKSQGMRNGKEEVFWHITTREQKRTVKQGKKFVTIKTRPFDLDRSCRIAWIRPILINHNHAGIKIFYRKETTGRKPVRLYLWAHTHDFVVIVQKLGKSDAFLVTSFYITERYKRASYQKLYNEYVSGRNSALNGYEWF